MRNQKRTSARIGRPPRYETVGPVDYHLGLRFDRLRKAQIAVIVAVENERAKTAGKKSRVTPSSLVSAWIRERLDVEIRRRGLATGATRGAKRELEELARNPRVSKKLLKALLDAQVSEARERDKASQGR
jgi:hypothetical protein